MFGLGGTELAIIGCVLFVVFVAVAVAIIILIKK